MDIGDDGSGVDHSFLAFFGKNTTNTEENQNDFNILAKHHKGNVDNEYITL